MDHTASVTTLQLKVNTINKIFLKRSASIISLLLLFLVLSTSAVLAQENEKAIKKSKKSDKKIELSADQKERINTLFFTALSQKNQGNDDAAISNLRKILDIDPYHAASYYEMGLAFSNKKLFSQAELAFDKAVEYDAENEWYLLQKAKLKEKLTKFEDAEIIYEKLAKKYPSKVNYLFDVASMKLYRNELKDAIKVYDQIEKKIGLNDDIVIQKEKIWLKLGNVEKAAEEIQKLISSQPNEPRYRMMLVELYMANNLQDDAYIALTNLIAIDAENGFAQLALADYYRQKNDLTKSYEILKKAFANNSINIDQKVRILAPYFSLLTDTLQMNRAIELSEIATSTHPEEAKAFAIYGDFLYQMQKLKEAKAAYIKTIALDKKVFAVWQNLMFIEAEQNDYAGLLKATNDAIELYPTNQLVHYMNAVAKSQTKDFEGAVVSYQMALNLLVNNKELEAQIYAGLGDAYHSLNNHTKSDASYEQALKLKPEDPYVLNNYAYYLSLRNEKLEKALEMSKKSNELQKNNASFLDTYAWIFYKLGNYEDAYLWMLEAKKHSATITATIADHLGDILYKLGKKEEALAEWERAKSLGDNRELLNKKIKEKKLYEE
jgi:tetratricopeptide (TPR) repeat protein